MSEDTVELIAGFLRWMKENHHGELWTPDAWSHSGVSPDNISPEVRAQQFLDLPTPRLDQFWHDVDESIAQGKETLKRMQR